MSVTHAYVAVTNDLNQDQRMHRICNTLIAEGYDVTLIGRKKKDSKILYDQPFTQNRLNLFFQSGVLFYLEYQIRLLIYLLRAKNPTLMYSVDLDTALPVRLAARIRNSKSSHDAHELFTEVPELMKSPIKRAIWKRVGKMTMNGFDHRFTVNDSLAKILEETYDCKFTSIRNLPTSKVKSTAKLKIDRPYIWYQGVLNEGRGLEEMIEAMSSLKDFDLRIAGEGDRSLTLRLLAEKSDAADRIIFHGWMVPKEMHDWACQAWLGINLLNYKSGNYYHSLANRTFDYVQAELPAIHMDFPEYRSILDEFKVGYLVDSLSSEIIVKSITELRSNNDLYDQLKEACRSAKMELTWEEESKVLASTIGNLK